MRVAIAGAAVAFLIQSAALAAGALWAGWWLHKSAADLLATPQPKVPQRGAQLRVVGNSGEAPR
ncbi:hypothetical protein PROPHIGD53-3_53 [Mycobacterium phage prophiGD53-3]|nr:hypothetical protein PROPHIGD53-3_53 [Mycobacterium phage prophiGD53-3]